MLQLQGLLRIFFSKKIPFMSVSFSHGENLTHHMRTAETEREPWFQLLTSSPLLTLKGHLVNIFFLKYGIIIMVLTDSHGCP